MSTNQTTGDESKTPNFHVVEDVKIVLRAELDQRTISFPALLGLEVGSVLQLTRPTGENVDLYAGNVLIGCGEILVMDSNLAVRMADLGGKFLHGRYMAGPDSANDPAG
jgi:flagellar motor switch/type III secretory pathway protein FliN